MGCKNILLQYKYTHNANRDKPCMFFCKGVCNLFREAIVIAFISNNNGNYFYRVLHKVKKPTYLLFAITCFGFVKTTKPNNIAKIE